MRTQKICSFFLGCYFLAACFFGEAQTKLTIDLTKPTKSVSPKLYGLMTEEINYSYDGGLYAELIRNRIFRDNPRAPDHWSLLQEGDAKGKISLDNKEPINESLTVSLKLDIDNSGKRIGISNDGYWGIPVKPSAMYRGSFYAKTIPVQSKVLTITIESADGKTVYATTKIPGINNQWKQYNFILTTNSDIKPTADTRFVISSADAGSYWFNLVSLFPETYHNRPNGNRTDIMHLLADMKPKFLRFPGGNYVEGEMFSTRFDWKKTIGSLEKRPGHASPWKYRSTDGMGLLEFLEWCEDLKMEPLLAVFAGYTLNKDYLDSGALLKPFVEEALEEIEYITGDVNTKWGAKRKLDGHPKPFDLSYVEIGNEDGFDMSGSYERRYLQFYDAIKAKYPNLQIISTVGGKDPLGQRVKKPVRNLDIVDEHYYRTASEMEEHADQYDNYDRNGPKVFVGEWATREGFPTTNFNSALGDAAWMAGMERNSDHIILSCYAPLFVNVNPGGMQWKSDMIGYDALNSFGSPSYYAQKMFNTYLGDQVVSTSAQNLPTQVTKLSGKDSAAGVTPKTIPAMFYVTTRDSKTGTLYLKVVNASGTAQTVLIDILGNTKVAANGTTVVLKADKPEDTNSITDPEKIIPVTAKVNGLGKSFTQIFPPYSIAVLKMEVK
jgi:alpha-N-arabinofuranosidase